MYQYICSATNVYYVQERVVNFKAFASMQFYLIFIIL
jgi:hypothetical protein